MNAAIFSSSGRNLLVDPVSHSGFQSWSVGEVPEAEEITDGIWSVPLPYKSGRITFTFAYLVQDVQGGFHVIDPGWESDDNLQVLVRSMSHIGGNPDDIASIVVTHLHADHIGLARRLRAQFDLPVYMHERDAPAQRDYVRWANDRQFIESCLDSWEVPAARREEVMLPALATPRKLVGADRTLEDGQLLAVPGRRLRVVHTPGHTPGHVCIHDEDAGLLFTGDHLLPKMTPGLGVTGYRVGNPLEEYFDSLNTVSEYDDCQSLPGHEFRYRGISRRAAQLAGRHLGRMAEVEEVLSTQPRLSVWETGARLRWARGWNSLTRHNLVAALRQTAMYADTIRSGAHYAIFERWGWSRNDRLTESNS